MISVWQNILQDLEDCRAGTLLAAINYAKALNKMEYQECLKSLARHGASSQIIRLIATFLSGKNMSVRVGQQWSNKLPVFGGVPQGSILGVLLFNVTTDNLEDRENATRLGTAAEARRSPMSSPTSTPHRPSSAQHWHSTPVGPETEFELRLTPFRRGGDTFVFLDNARNVRRALTGADVTILRD